VSGYPAASAPFLFFLRRVRLLTGRLIGLSLLSTLLATLLSGLLPSRLGLISPVIYICHKYVSPSISIIFIIDDMCDVAGANPARSSRRTAALRHTLLGNDHFGSKDQYSANTVKIIG